MSFYEALTKGEIKLNEKCGKRALTPYDRFAKRRRALLNEDKYLEISAYKPKNFDDLKIILNNLKAKNGVVVDFGLLSDELAQRMLDFLSGGVFVLGGSVKRIEKSTYIFTPKEIEVASK